MTFSLGTVKGHEFKNPCIITRFPPHPQRPHTILQDLQKKLSTIPTHDNYHPHDDNGQGHWSLIRVMMMMVITILLIMMIILMLMIRVSHCRRSDVEAPSMECLLCQRRSLQVLFIINNNNNNNNNNIIIIIMVCGKNTNGQNPKWRFGILSVIIIIIDSQLPMTSLREAIL